LARAILSITLSHGSADIKTTSQEQASRRLSIDALFA